jgi:hypothetical protein
VCVSRRIRLICRKVHDHVDGMRAWVTWYSTGGGLSPKGIKLSVTEGASMKGGGTCTKLSQGKSRNGCPDRTAYSDPIL